MSELEIIAVSGVVYKVKNTGPSTEPCGTPYERVTLPHRVSLLFTDWCLFLNKKKTHYEPCQIFHTIQKVYLLI